MEKQVLVTKSSLPPFEEYVDEIKDIWQTHWLTNMGEKHQALQRALEEYMQAEHLELIVNGHMALELTLQAMNLTGEVITTPFTFASTTHAIVRNGLKPVFCDINAEDYTMDAEKIEALITDRTSAIMPVHVYGNVCNVDEIARIATKYGLKVIYDAAHTFGECYRGKSVASYGDASCLSFHATKVFNSIEGGAVCYHDEKLGRRLYDLKNFGIRGPEDVEYVGANAKMNEFAAAMGLCNLRHVDEAIQKRRRLVACYREHLVHVDGIRLNAVQKDVESNYAYFPIVIEEKVFGFSRNEVFQALSDKNIMARKYFYPLTNSFACFHGAYDPADTPVAQHVANRVLTLPLYADLTIDIVERISDIIIQMKDMRTSGKVFG